jgi:hypothetical protein
MPFRYPCFISYRSGQNSLMLQLLEDLDSALRAELDAYDFGPISDLVFIDKQRLEGGQFFNPVLAKALCESVCLIAIYTQSYFSNNHLYCTREYMGMESLEGVRRQLISGDPAHRGLIIPVVLRGLKFMPGVVKENRNYYDFQSYTTASKRITKHPKLVGEVQRIAEYIFSCYRLFNGLRDDPCSNCQGYKLPTDDEARNWLARVAPTQETLPLPGR